MDNGYKEMIKANSFFKNINQRSLTKYYLDRANKNYRTAVKLLLDLNKQYNSAKFATQLQENKELIACVEEVIEENSQRIKSLYSNDYA
ncbi:MAG: hypothetical protein MHPSP_004134 [Paramarteilia canceri]